MRIREKWEDRDKFPVFLFVHGVSLEIHAEK